MFSFHVITIFPEFVRSVFQYGVVRRALESGALTAEVHDLRDYTRDKHRSTDDSPYGGGPGMVMLAEPVFAAVEALRAEHGPLPLVYLSPAGQPLTHTLALELASGARAGTQALACKDEIGTQALACKDEIGPQALACKRETGPQALACKDETGPQASACSNPSGTQDLISTEEETRQAKACAPGLILLCGRYEGIDQRIIDKLVDREVSIGDYVLSGGELAAMVLLDAVARLLPGVLGNDASSGSESFAGGLLDWPHYTRPEEFREWPVPPILLSGNHAKILDWREKRALLLTYRRRPELLSEEQLAAARRLAAQEEERRPERDEIQGRQKG